MSKLQNALRGRGFLSVQPTKIERHPMTTSFIEMNDIRTGALADHDRPLSLGKSRGEGMVDVPNDSIFLTSQKFGRIMMNPCKNPYKSYNHKVFYVCASPGFAWTVRWLAVCRCS